MKILSCLHNIINCICLKKKLTTSKKDEHKDILYTNNHHLKKLFDKKTFKIIQEISPKDQMYVFGKAHYFHVGESALKNIKLAILLAGKDFIDIKDILDMPCGHGRVLRMLRAAFPKSQITACDLDRDAVDFCAKTFDANPVYSEEHPDKIQIKDKFDLIWCGSLLTHLNLDRWCEFLNFFNSILKQGGILIFTTHGRFSADMIRCGRFTYGLDPVRLKTLLNEYDRNGFGYSNYAQTDNYGISLSSPSYVLSMLEKIPNFYFLMYNEQGWDEHQDVIACIKRDYKQPIFKNI